MSSDHNKKVYIIIPVHNRMDLTLSCLAHLHLTGDDQRYSIIVVDDGSTDGTGAAISESYPDVILLKGDGNLWWTGGIAKGMEYAYSQGAEYFIWLNDDCRPDDMTVREMVAYAAKNTNTIVAPAVYPENSSVPRSNGFIGRKTLDTKTEGILMADGVSGYCVIIPRSVYDKIGLPDAKKYPHYSGDVMYTLKAKRNGFDVSIIGSIRARLLGLVGENHLIQTFVKEDDSLATSFKKIFRNIKSPHYLPTKYYFYTEKYNFFVGHTLFIIKISVCSLKIIYHKVVTSRLRMASHSTT